MIHVFNILIIFRFIITSDRDEKVHVTNYPDTHEIQNICLGHTEFVSSLAFVDNDKLLLTSSGDKTLRFWNFESGKEIFQNTLEFVPITVLVGTKFLAIVDIESSVHVFKYEIDASQTVKIEELGCKKYNGNINTANDADTFYVEYLESQTLLIDRISIEDSSVTFDAFRDATKSFNHSVHESFSIFKPFDVTLLFKKRFDNPVTYTSYADKKKSRIEREMAKKMKLDEC